MIAWTPNVMRDPPPQAGGDALGMWTVGVEDMSLLLPHPGPAP